MTYGVDENNELLLNTVQMVYDIDFTHYKDLALIGNFLGYVKIGFRVYSET